MGIETAEENISIKKEKVEMLVNSSVKPKWRGRK